MKITTERITRRVILAVSLASLLVTGFALSGGRGIVPTAHGQEKAAKKCSERTVRGTYGFALTGHVQGVGPIAASGTTTFDGEGYFSITGRINTATGDPVLEGTFPGTYTVSPDGCTASATVTTPGVFSYTELHFEAVILENGREIRYLITNPGIVFAGATVKQ